MTNKQPEQTETTAPWNEQPNYVAPLPEAAWVAWTPVAIPVMVSTRDDEDPFGEPTKEKRLVPWNLTLRGNDTAEVMDTLAAFVETNPGVVFITDKTWYEFKLNAPKALPVNYADLVAPPLPASPLPVAQPGVMSYAEAFVQPITQAAPAPIHPAVAGMPAATQMSQPGSDGYGEFLAKTIKVGVNKAMTRTMFRMAGEQFTEFGVLCWENTLNDVGIVTSGMQRGTSYENIGTWKCTYSLKPDGKPDIVVKLERVA